MSFNAESTRLARLKLSNDLNAAFADGGLLEDRDNLWDELELSFTTGDRCAARDDHAGAFLAFGGGWARLQELLEEAAHEAALLADAAQDALDAALEAADA